MDSWLDRANKSISQGGLTNSKWPESYLRGLYPTHIKGANGCHLYDTNNIKYVDFICGLGSNLFGYGNEFITQAILKHLYNGANHSLPTIHEVECAEKLKELFPFVERVKWLKTGGDACAAALKFARAYTGRNNVISEGYHGWSDDFVSMTPPSIGVPPRDWMKTIDYDFSKAAAVIVEPVIIDDSRERINWLRTIRHECTKNGTVLIFDEVITGLRYEKYGVCNKFGILPDLICFGKAVGAGYSLAGVCGKAEILDNREVFVSSTYAGETIPLIAGKTGMELLQKKPEYSLDFLIEKGREFTDTFNSFGGVKLKSYGTRGTFEGTMEDRAIFCQEMAKCFVLFHPSTWFFNFPLISVMDDVLNTIEAVKDKIRMGKVKLEFPLPSSPFSAKVRKT
jgi:glutamate-1-semialdehyde 2,1-aminomutase